MEKPASFFENIFSNISQKLKTSAKIVFISGVLISLISGIVMFSKASDVSHSNSLLYAFIEDQYAVSNILIWLGLFCMFGGSALSVLSAFQLYGIGVAAEKTAAESTIDSKRSSFNQPEEVILANVPLQKCSLCESMVDTLTEIKLIDDFGTRYRRICPHCLEEYRKSKQ